MRDGAGVGRREGVFGGGCEGMTRRDGGRDGWEVMGDSRLCFGNIHNMGSACKGWTVWRAQDRRTRQAFHLHIHRIWERDP